MFSRKCKWLPFNYAFQPGLPKDSVSNGAACYSKKEQDVVLEANYSYYTGVASHKKKI